MIFYRKVKKKSAISIFLRSRRMDECAYPDLESSRRVIYGQSEGYVVLVDLSKGPQDLSGTCMGCVDPPDIPVNH